MTFMVAIIKNYMLALNCKSLTCTRKVPYKLILICSMKAHRYLPQEKVLIMCKLAT